MLISFLATSKSCSLLTYILLSAYRTPPLPLTRKTRAKPPSAMTSSTVTVFLPTTKTLPTKLWCDWSLLDWSILWKSFFILTRFLRVSAVFFFFNIISSLPLTRSRWWLECVRPSCHSPGPPQPAFMSTPQPARGGALSLVPRPRHVPPL